jgi:Xaa-Pro aminopeptidase
MSHEQRIEQVRGKLADAEVDALLVTNATNVGYLTGFTGTNGQVLVLQSDAVFFSDPRYAARAADLVRAAEVDIYPTRLTEVLPGHLKRARVSRLGFEAATMTVAERDDLADRLVGVDLAATKGVVEDLRRHKDEEEVALLREAVRIADETFEWVLERLEPGRSEREIALALEIRMRERGADEASFRPIVGSGPLSSHIHHTPSDRLLERGDLVLLDFGARWRGYCSDLTRTVVLGPARDEHLETYDLVLEAQRRGIEAVAVGAAGVRVDAAARDVIAAAGHEAAFGHGLGHGVGLDIHEAPRLAKTSEDELRAGDVVTVEPGVYRVGQGGIRIEDCVLVTPDGGEVLGKAPKSELVEL